MCIPIVKVLGIVFFWGVCCSGFWIAIANSRNQNKFIYEYDEIMNTNIVCNKSDNIILFSYDMENVLYELVQLRLLAVWNGAVYWPIFSGITNIVCVLPSFYCEEKVLPMTRNIYTIISVILSNSYFVSYPFVYSFYPFTYKLEYYSSTLYNQSYVEISLKDKFSSNVIDLNMPIGFNCISNIRFYYSLYNNILLEYNAAYTGLFVLLVFSIAIPAIIECIRCKSNYKFDYSLYEG
jgi:hypothetical protein